MSIIMQREFLKNVENYIFKNDKRYAKAIQSKKNQIPVNFRSPRYLYRGMILDESIIDSIKSGQPLKLTDITSWTTDPKLSERFVSDSSKIVKSKGNGTGVIFKKNFSSQKIILDIQNYLLFMDVTGILDEVGFDDSTKEMGLEEFEVLVDGNVSLSRNDIFKIVK